MCHTAIRIRRVIGIMALTDIMVIVTIITGIGAILRIINRLFRHVGMCFEPRVRKKTRPIQHGRRPKI